MIRISRLGPLKLMEINRWCHLIHRTRQRLQRKPLAIRPAHTTAAMACQGIVHFFGDVRISGHPLEGMPKGVKDLGAIHHAARRAQIAAKPF